MTMCPREQDILAAQRTGAWTDDLRIHLAQCDDCTETLMVAGFLRQADETADATPAHPGLVWWRMQLRARRDDALRATRPIRIAERFIVAIGALATVGGIAWLSTVSTAAAGAAVAGLLVLGAISGSALWFASSRK